MSRVPSPVIRLASPGLASTVPSGSLSIFNNTSVEWMHTLRPRGPHESTGGGATHSARWLFSFGKLATPAPQRWQRSGRCSSRSAAASSTVTRPVLSSSAITRMTGMKKELVKPFQCFLCFMAGLSRSCVRAQADAHIA